MITSVAYRGFTIMAKPILLESGEWSTEVRLMRGDTVKPYSAENTWKSEEEAVKYCLEFGMRIIDGEIREFNAGDLP